MLIICETLKLVRDINEEMAILIDMLIMSCLGFWYDHGSSNILWLKWCCSKSQTFEVLIEQGLALTMNRNPKFWLGLQAKSLLWKVLGMKP